MSSDSTREALYYSPSFFFIPKPVTRIHWLRKETGCPWVVRSFAAPYLLFLFFSYSFILLLLYFHFETFCNQKTFLSSIQFHRASLHKINRKKPASSAMQQHSLFAMAGASDVQTEATVASWLARLVRFWLAWVWNKPNQRQPTPANASQRQQHTSCTCVFGLPGLPYYIVHSVCAVIYMTSSTAEKLRFRGSILREERFE